MPEALKIFQPNRGQFATFERRSCPEKTRTQSTGADTPRPQTADRNEGPFAIPLSSETF
jgi:hypothetical protein